MPRPFYYRQTHGIRISVRPMYLPDRSNPDARHFVFAYFVRIENVGTETVQLRSRRWLIHDSVGEDVVVEGEGVVGEQPVLGRGEVHEYQSFCILKSSVGHMEGSYFFLRGADTLEAQIPRFHLDATDLADPLQ